MVNFNTSDLMFGMMLQLTVFSCWTQIFFMYQTYKCAHAPGDDLNLSSSVDLSFFPSVLGSMIFHDIHPASCSARKSIMREGHAEDFGFTAEELAKRACYEFETWLPRVMSWHDYQYRCFWFFGGKDTNDRNRDSGASKSFFSSDAEAAWRH